jgi:hypothetical protein|tara:strand:- start:444 stop:650 length:207 start_codon:yes stop_codon:yes gene_type:complete
MSMAECGWISKNSPRSGSILEGIKGITGGIIREFGPRLAPDHRELSVKSELLDSHILEIMIRHAQVAL